MNINTVKFTMNAKVMAAVINGVVTDSITLRDFCDLKQPEGFTRL